MEQQFTVWQARSLCRDAERLLGDAQTLLDELEGVRREAGVALGAVRERAARRELASIPVARLKDVTGGRLRLGALEKSGYTTVGQVLEASPYTLQLLPGIGAQTAGQVHAAAEQLARASAEAASVRIDVDDRDATTTALVIALHRLVAVGPDLPKAEEVARGLVERLAPLLAEARPARNPLRMALTLPGRKQRARAALAALEPALDGARATRLLLAQVTTDLLRPPVGDIEAWADFETRSADYYSLVVDPVPADRGALPEDLVARVEAQELDDTHRRVSLRGYQSFGARFALAQRRVIVGDEMGLGKSIEAIAALAHLRSLGAERFLVVCPTSVLINWVREITARSTLLAVPLHGPDRTRALDEWVRRGGVAVATLDSLHRLEVPPSVEVAMLVVDEAHYVKNPAAQRSKAVAAWCRRVERVLFLTGTPMENRVEEFRSLVSYLQPSLAAELRGSDMAAAFRKAVAPAYLRRNTQDVLTELPDRVEADEWVEFTGDDVTAYRRAVVAGNFMAMRRAGFAVPANSAKLKRLLELVEDARVNGLKVIVFSYFRDVLAAVGQALGGAAHGPISGSLPPARRQEVVDTFTGARGHAVLLGQVQAGGVGLNLQAASVVILCEPQVKPSMEAQAVARAHRMGQVRKVQVHRLLAVDTVDQRLLDILGAKERLFDSYARRSDLAESSAAAVDVSEQALARQIIEEEQRRLAL